MAAIPTLEYHGSTVYRIGPMDRLLRTLDLAHKARSGRRLCLITGEPGSGKSLGVHMWCDSHPNDTVYVDTPTSSLLRTGRLLELLEQALLLPVHGQPTLYARTRTIIDRLVQDPRMIVFDEADRLRRGDHLDLLRYIHDEADARFAFVTIPALRGVFMRRPELARRVSNAMQLDPLTAEQTGMIVAQVLPQQPLAIVEAIHALSRGLMGDLLVLLDHIQEYQGNLTADVVRRIARRFTLAQVA